MKNSLTVLAGLLAAALVHAAPNLEVRKDIEFTRAGSVSLKLDAHLQAGSRKPAPCIVWVHGGGFVSGDKAGYPHALLDPILESGFAMISLNYRLAPQHPFPACVDDVEAGEQFLDE